MVKVVFFGLGAVGSVMACCLYELSEKDNDKIRFIFVVRDKEKAKRYLFRAPHILKKSEFLVVKDFKLIFQNPEYYAKHLNNSSIFINASIPNFNIQILKLAIKFKACYTDMASEYTSKAINFPQENFHERLENAGLFGLINNGVSPGLTNFLVGEKLKNMKQLKILKNVEAINLYLLENMESEQTVFSWSPEVALEELESKPIYIQNNKLVMVEPFSHSLIYEFSHFRGSMVQYPINQEEVISLHKSFPQIKSIKISTGGSEIELIKNLFQLNLLSKKNIECVKK
ncbi:MAG: saccharopine dehydrogenase NADP-binding domain-containing protein [Candidatus Pacearchaeota archaeon]